MVAIAPFVVVIFLQPSAVLCEAEVTEWVQRRQIGDLYGIYNSSEDHRSCDSIKANSPEFDTINVTYLVDENQCVNYQQLLKGN